MQLSPYAWKKMMNVMFWERWLIQSNLILDFISAESKEKKTGQDKDKDETLGQVIISQKPGRKGNSSRFYTYLSIY